MFAALTDKRCFLLRKTSPLATHFARVARVEGDTGHDVGPEDDQDKLAIEANDFQALQKGTPGLTAAICRSDRRGEPRVTFFPTRPRRSEQEHEQPPAVRAAVQRERHGAQGTRATGIERERPCSVATASQLSTLSNDPPLTVTIAASFSRKTNTAQELELEDDANVLKLIGPVLIKQDLVEASNVQKRLEFIQNETERLDKMVKSMENKQETKHREIQELQKSCRRRR